VDQLHVGHVHELHLDGVLSQGGKKLRNAVGYYTLNFVPEIMKK